MADKATSVTQKPRVGRPRASAAISDQDARDEILAAASKLFSQRGYEGTQLNQIAAAAGLRTPSLYHYFQGKKEIRLALSAFAVDQSAAFAIDMLQEQGRASAKIYRLLANHVDHLTAGPYDLWFLVTRTGLPEGGGWASEERYAAWLDAIGRLVATAIEEGDFHPVNPAVALHMIIGAVHGALALHHINQRADSREIARFVVRGLSTNSGRAEAAWSSDTL
jgi:AcrR family transcriptional regulator